MEYPHPDILKNVELTSVRLVSSEYREMNKPEPNSKGFIKLSLTNKPTFKKKEGDEFPNRLIQYAEICMQAFMGEDKPDAATAANEIALCRIKIAVTYKMSKPQYSESEYIKLQWYFQPHVTLLARGYIRDILRDTNLRGVPIPFEINP